MHNNNDPFWRGTPGHRSRTFFSFFSPPVRPRGGRPYKTTIPSHSPTIWRNAYIARLCLPCVWCMKRWCCWVGRHITGHNASVIWWVHLSESMIRASNSHSIPENTKSPTHLSDHGPERVSTGPARSRFCPR